MGTKVLYNIGQAGELVFDPIQPEYRLKEREEQTVKWGIRLRVLTSEVLT